VRAAGCVACASRRPAWARDAGAGRTRPPGHHSGSAPWLLSGSWLEAHPPASHPSWGNSALLFGPKPRRRRSPGTKVFARPARRWHGGSGRSCRYRCRCPAECRSGTRRGLAVNRAVVVDDRLRTNDPMFSPPAMLRNIAASPGLMDGRHGARKAGRRALAGEEVVFQGTPPATQLKVINWPVFSIGALKPKIPRSGVRAGRHSPLVRIVLRNNTVMGATWSATQAWPARCGGQCRNSFRSRPCRSLGSSLQRPVREENAGSSNTPACRIQ